MIYIYMIWYTYIYICDMWYTTVGNDHPCVFLVFRCEKHVVDLFNMYLTCLNSKQGCQQQEMRIEVAEEMGIWPARHGSNQHSGIYIYIRIYIYILWSCGTSKWWHAQTCKNNTSLVFCGGAVGAQNNMMINHWVPWAYRGFHDPQKIQKTCWKWTCQRFLQFL